MKIILVFVILFSNSIFNLKAKGELKDSSQNHNNTIQITQLKNVSDSLKKEIEFLKIEKGFYQSIIDSNTTYYITIIALITFILGSISLTYFTFQSKKINKLLKNVSKQEERIDSLISIQQNDKIEADYTYANVCNILGGLEIKEPYLNFNKSFYYYMRTIKYLLLSKRNGGIYDNLNNARSALLLVRDAKVVSPDKWKLEERHIIEIRETFLELSRNEDISIKELNEVIVKNFENNLDRLKSA